MDITDLLGAPMRMKAIRNGVVLARNYAVAHEAGVQGTDSR